ncbi:MAG TPA: putative Ig domain-containing protein, partial [Candidatus Paceibacterota bacterium]|nr:putative Ig domain-containing protein [Candidatus Paceibacterota bacterium]
APVLPGQADVTVAELETLVVTNTASDADLPANGLTYSLVNAPAGASIDAQGVITWTPTEEQGPSTNLLVTVVTDDGTPALSATNSFVVVVEEVNSPPVLSVVPDVVLTGAVHLILTNAATDPDMPMNSLAYELLVGPPGATIDDEGIISWPPAPDQVPSTNLFTTVVWDDGLPPLSATNTFTVTVRPDPAQEPPVIQSIEFLGGEVRIRWTAAAGVRYRLEYKDDFTVTNWTPAEPEIVATEELVTVTNVLHTTSQRFYRVYVVP